MRALDSEVPGAAAAARRLKSGANLRVRVARPDPPPRRYGAARLCVVSRVENGRDVGLAESSFRPTSLGRDRFPVVVSGGQKQAANRPLPIVDH